MRIALADCSEHHEGVASERALWDALDERGVEFERPAWDREGTDWSAFDAVVVRTTWNYHHAPAEFLAWVEGVAARTQVFNSPEVLRWNSEKSYLRELIAAGVPVAPTLWFEVGKTVDLHSLLAEQAWERAMLKPLVGAVASDTLRFNADEEGLAGAQVFLDGRLEERAMMIQPYLGRVEIGGEISVLLVDGEPTHSVRKVPLPGEYRVQDEHGASDHAVPLDPALVTLARRCLEVVPGSRVPLYARADFLFDDDDRAVLNELELIEPMFFFQHHPEAADTFADALLARISGDA
ncbi:MAG: hypothetical protein VYE81_05140 [Planctomycetota bacterium]|nr:hypothetical protein [Planctomycetota bacterium]